MRAFANCGETVPASSTVASLGTTPAGGATNTFTIAVSPAASASVTVPRPFARPVSVSVWRAGS